MSQKPPFDEVDALRRLRDGVNVSAREQTLMVAHGTAYVKASDGSLQLTPHGRELLETGTLM